MMDDKNKDFIDALTYAAEMFAKTNESKQQTKTEELAQLFIPEDAEKWDKVNGLYIYHSGGNIEQIPFLNKQFNMKK